MKVVIPGGRGQIGTLLTRAFTAAGHEVVVLSRRPETGSAEAGAARVVGWDGAAVGPWAAELDGADVVINLAGRSVDCRYTTANRRAILRSRVDSTRAVGAAVAVAARPPRVWLQASTATIYAHRYDADNDEATGVLGGSEPTVPETWRFSIEVARAWEAATEEFDLPHTRRVLLRSAITLSPDPGGAFAVLLGLVRAGLGGTVGDGRQYVSWIHDADFVRAVLWLIEHDLSGAVNVAAPHPLPNREFMQELRAAWSIRVGLPAPGPLLSLGAWLLRTEPELVLKSRRVVPGRLAASGFEFEFPEWPAAADDLCRRWRAGKRPVAFAPAI